MIDCNVPAQYVLLHYQTLIFTPKLQSYPFSSENLICNMCIKSRFLNVYSTVLKNFASSKTTSGVVDGSCSVMDDQEVMAVDHLL